MKIAINIKLRNPEWYWKDKKKKGEMPREEWMMINKDKIQKHSWAWTYDFLYEVKNITENPETNYELKMISVNEFKERKNHSFILENVSLIEIHGEKEKTQIVVSNEIIHQFISRKKEKGVFHWYFYLKENANFTSICDNIWITKEQFDQIKKLFIKNGNEEILIEKNKNIELRIVHGQMPIYREF